MGPERVTWEAVVLMFWLGHGPAGAVGGLPWRGTSGRRFHSSRGSYCRDQLWEGEGHAQRLLVVGVDAGVAAGWSSV